MIICICSTFKIYDSRGIPTGREEFVVSHGICTRTGRTVILPNEHPAKLGARLDRTMMEWVLDEPDDL